MTNNRSKALVIDVCACVSVCVLLVWGEWWHVVNSHYSEFGMQGPFL